MLHAVICIDKPGHLETRKANRDDHLAPIRSTDGAITQARDPAVDLDPAVGDQAFQLPP